MLGWTVARRSIAADLFVGEGDLARLIGGRRKNDGRIVFPLASGPERDGFEAIELAHTGSLWSFTVQRFRPKPPYLAAGDESAFEPYAVGYVELPGQIVVESRLEAGDPADLHIGQPMRMTTQVLRREDNGDEVLTYAFRPLAAGEVGP